jgi:uncharacterized protein
LLAVKIGLKPHHLREILVKFSQHHPWWEEARAVIIHGLLGALTGLLFGFVIQRGRFDMAAGFQSFYLRREQDQLKSYVLAVVVQAVIIFLLVRSGVAAVPSMPFHGPAAVVGGLVFGAGMALTGSGAAGIWTRLGQGLADGLITVLGFALGAAAATTGIAATVVQHLQTVQTIRFTTIYDVLQVGFGTAVSFAAVLSAWWFSFSYARSCQCSNMKPHHKDSLFPGLAGQELSFDLIMELIFKRTWSWVATGAAMGLATGLAWFTAAHSKVAGGLEVTTGTAGLLRYIVGGGTVPSWSAFLVLGIPLGALVGARMAGEQKAAEISPRTLLRGLGGGLLMGMGAVTALGDDIASGLTGTAFFSLNGMIATVFMFAGAWAVSYGLSMLDTIRVPGDGRPQK